MAFDPAPSAWLGDGYSLSSSMVRMTTVTAGSDICLPELTDTEANASTGDIRKVAFAISEAMHAAWAAMPEADRPVEMTLQKQVNPLTGGNQLQVIYTQSFTIDITGQEVADEPV